MEIGPIAPGEVEISPKKQTENGDDAHVIRELETLCGLGGPATRWSFVTYILRIVWSILVTGISFVYDGINLIGYRVSPTYSYRFARAPLLGGPSVPASEKPFPFMSV